VRFAIIGPDDKIVHIQRRTAMKRLMTLMLGLAFLTTTVVVAYGQDTSTSTAKKKKSGKKKAEPKTGTPQH
jgi:preprotein translocase subunit SecG